MFDVGTPRNASEVRRPLRFIPARLSWLAAVLFILSSATLGCGSDEDSEPGTSPVPTGGSGPSGGAGGTNATGGSSTGGSGGVGPVLFSRQFGDGAEQHAQAVAFDNQDQVLVLGAAQGTIDLGAGPLTSSGDFDIFLAKYSVTGQLQWGQLYGGSDEQQPTAMDVDDQSNVLVTGAFEGQLTIGTTVLTSAGNQDVFVAKFAADGSPIWAKGFGDSVAQNAECVAIDSDNYVLVAGSFSGSLDFGCASAISCASTDNIYLAKLDTDGACLWARAFCHDGQQAATGLAIGSDDDVIMVGYYENDIDLEGLALFNAGGTDVFIASFDSDGNHQWSNGYGDSADQRAAAVASDAAGKFTVGGQFASSINFGGAPLASVGGADMFVVAYNNLGFPQWGRRIGAESTDLLMGVAMSSGGRIGLTGSFSNTLTFDQQTVACAGADDIFVGVLDAQGAVIQVVGFGDPSANQLGRGVAKTATHTAVVGSFNGTADFGGGVLTSAGGADGFIVLFGPEFE